MRKILISLISGFCFLSTSITQAQSNSDALAVSSVASKITDKTGQTFDLTLAFTLHESLKGNWALGFYSARPFLPMGANFNPKITFTLVSKDGKTAISLQFITKSMNPYVYGAGYTTILAPKTNTALIPGSYQLIIKNGNQWAPVNISTMPQNFFIVTAYNTNKPSFIQTEIPKQAYSIGGYNQQTVNTQIQTVLQEQVSSSMPVSNNLAQQLNLVPTPTQVTALNSKGLNVNVTAFAVNSSFIDKQNFGFLQQYLQQDLNAALITNPNESQPPITVNQSNAITNLEGYQLQVSASGIIVNAKTQAGIFYAIQTLRQLIYYAQYHNNGIIPALSILDQPRFKYRGMMLDLSRHNLAANGSNKLAHLENFIDLMATQKLNTLHIHFADDEGWRLALDIADENAAKALANQAQLRGFVPNSVQPALVFEQANLDKSNYTGQNQNTGKQLVKHYPNATTPYQGTYSKADIQALIRYANARQITIIPEIELPGHTRALVQSLPAFQDPNDKSQFASVQGYYDNVVPVCKYGQNNSFTTELNQIANKINDWFADQTTLYAKNEVSVSGDEVSADAWTNDSSCNNSSYQNLTALNKAQYFFNNLQADTGLKISGWQQIVQEDDTTGQGFAPIGQYAVAADHIGHTWVWEISGSSRIPNPQDKNGGINDAAWLAAHNYPVVLDFADDTYFDLTYTPDQWEPGFTWANNFSDTFSALKIARDASKVEQAIKDKLYKPAAVKNVLGVEGALWSENLNNYRHLIYMAAPKITGLAEAAWSDENITVNGDKIDWLSLANRLGTQNNAHGFLDFLQQKVLVTLPYRGYPNGVKDELPE